MNKCLDCGKELSTNPKAIRCHSCENKRRIRLKIFVFQGNKNPNYKSGKFCNNKFCLDCNKKISKEAIRCLSCNAKKRTGKKNSNFGKHHFGMNSGEKNHFWIHGKSREPYPIEFTDTLKESIRKRDSYICQNCEKKGNVVHHIDYDKQNCNRKNLITLCNRCHIKTNFNRDYWFAYFTYIMNEIE